MFLVANEDFLKVDKLPSLSKVITSNSKATLICCTFCIVLGIVGGIAASYSAIRELSTTHFIPPCYIEPFLTHSHTSSISHAQTNCCGHFMNISRYGNESKCATADLNYYT
uniref:Uncharacterized protein n=1 Tax=Acrobeloides nanus TaxID=290746 RepID=A0A914C2Y9_9BILA